MYGVDVSNFSDGPVTVEQARLVRDSNRRIIIGTQDIEIAVKQVEAAKVADLDIQLYVFFYTGVPIAREINKTAEVIRRTGLDNPMVWLDFEDESTDEGLSQDMYAGWVQRIIGTMETGFSNIGIYTSRGWWTKHIGNIHIAGHLPLWDANWDGLPFAPFIPYGDWATATMKQYLGDQNLWGMKVDYNVYAL